MTNRLWVTLHISVNGIISFPMANRQWVALLTCMKDNLMTLLFLWSTGCERHCTFVWKAIWLHLFPVTNREWVTLHILWKAVSSHLFLWPWIGCEWHCTFLWNAVLSHHQQQVSGIAHFCEWQCHHMALNRQWVSLHIYVNGILIWPTASQWHCTFCERQSHHIFSYDKQHVSVIAHFCERKPSHHLFSYDQ